MAIQFSTSNIGQLARVAIGCVSLLRFCTNEWNRCHVVALSLCVAITHDASWMVMRTFRAPRVLMAHRGTMWRIMRSRDALNGLEFVNVMGGALLKNRTWTFFARTAKRNRRITDSFQTHGDQNVPNLIKLLEHCDTPYASKDSEIFGATWQLWRVPAPWKINMLSSCAPRPPEK